MITEKEYNEIKLGSIIENENLCLLISLMKFETEGDSSAIVLFDLTRGSFVWFNKIKFKKECKIANKTNLSKLLNGSSPLMETVGLYLLKSIDLFLNNPDEYNRIQPGTKIKLDNKFAEILKDKNDYEKNVIDTRTNRKYNLIEIKEYNGQEYVRLLRRNFVCLELRETESLCVPMDEFNKYYITERTEEEKERKEEIQRFEGTDQDVDVLYHDCEVEFENNVDTGLIPVSNNNLLDKLPKVPDEFIELNEKLKNSDVDVISYNLDECNIDEIEMFDFDTFLKIIGNDIIEEDVLPEKLEDMIVSDKIIKYNSYEDFQDNNCDLNDFRFITDFKEGDMYVLLSPMFDFVKIIEVLDDQVLIEMYNVIQIKETGKQKYMKKSKFVIDKFTLSQFILYSNTIDEMVKTKKIIPNLYYHIRERNIGTFDHVYNLIKGTFIEKNEINEDEVNYSIARRPVKQKDDVFGHNYVFAPISELKNALINEYYSKYNISIKDNDMSKLAIGRGLYFEGNSFTVLKVNRQYVYLCRNICNIKDRAIIRLKKKDFEEHENDFEYFNIIDMSFLYN